MAPPWVRALLFARVSLAYQDARPLPTLTALWPAVAAAACLAGLVSLHWQGIQRLAELWSGADFSHGYVIPFIGGYLLLRALGRQRGGGAGDGWIGLTIVALAILAAALGRLARTPGLEVYALILMLFGLACAGLGWRRAARCWPAFAYLLFMVPVPTVLYEKLSVAMQLISTRLGADAIALMGIPVFRDGNVIDLGPLKLQVAEACNGLRYLFPLTSFGFLLAVVLNARPWQRIAVALATVPIAVVLNGLRIAATGLLMDRFGTQHAEGFLHLFEGWVVFLLCLLVLYAVALLLLRPRFWRRGGGPLLDLDWPAARRGLAALQAAAPGAPLTLAVAIVAAAGLAAATMPARAMLVPPSPHLASFPTRLEGWTGRPTRLEPATEAALKADAYLTIGYVATPAAPPVNLFVAYYGQQTSAGKDIHTPEVCITGAGWDIVAFADSRAAVDLAAGSIPIRRAVIRKGEQTGLVYYWFQERGRVLTSEYLHKLYVMYDGVVRRRNDGALVRIDTPIGKGEDIGQAEQRLQAFLQASYGSVATFLPR